MTAEPDMEPEMEPDIEPDMEPDIEPDTEPEIEPEIETGGDDATPRDRMLTVPVALDGERLDRVVALGTGLTRAAAADAVRSGGVSVDGTIVTKVSTAVRAAQVVGIARGPVVATLTVLAQNPISSSRCCMPTPT